MIKYCLFIAFAMFSFCERLQGQNQRVIDSLREVLLHRTGGDRFPVLYDLTFEYFNTDKKTAFDYILQAETAAEFSGDSLWIVKSRRVKGQLLYFLERNDEASLACKSALPISVRNGFLSEEFYLRETLGKCNLFWGNYDDALRFLFRTTELAKQLGDSAMVSRSYNVLGVTYYKLKAYRKAVSYYQKCLSTYPFDLRKVHSVLGNMSLCYAHLGDYQKARIYIERSLQYCGGDCPRDRLINIEYAFGLIALGEGVLAAAERHLLKSYQMAVEVEDTRFQLDNIYLLVDLYMKHARIAEAAELLDIAEKIIAAHPPYNLELIKIYSRLAEFHVASQNYKSASEYQVAYIRLKDSVYNEALTNGLMKIESEHLERENEARISAQQEIILLKQQAIDRQVRINFLTAAFGILMAVFAFFIYRNFRLKQNLNRILDEKVKQRTWELERNQNELMAALNEREIVIRRISQGITDAVSTLSGLSLTLIQERTPPVPLDFGQKIEKTCQRLKRYLLFGEGERALKA